MEEIKASELYQYILKFGNAVDIVDSYSGYSSHNPIITLPANIIRNEKYLMEEYGVKLVRDEPIKRTIDYKYKKCTLVRITDEGEILKHEICIFEDMMDKDIYTVSKQNAEIRKLLDNNIHHIFEKIINNYEVWRYDKVNYRVERGFLNDYQYLRKVGEHTFIDFDKFKDIEIPKCSFLLDRMRISFYQYSDNKDESKSFDYIVVRVPIIRRNNSNTAIIESFKKEKSEIYRVIMKAIQNRPEYKRFKIPFNFFECTNLVLTRDSILEFTFDFKKI